MRGVCGEIKLGGDEQRWTDPVKTINSFNGLNGCQRDREGGKEGKNTKRWKAGKERDGTLYVMIDQEMRHTRNPRAVLAMTAVREVSGTLSETVQSGSWGSVAGGRE